MGEFYGKLRTKRKDDVALARCVEEVVDKLESASTSDNSPGMLLGKIQSGKTRAFVGIIAEAFDRGFDIAIVLTKGTKTLSAQTVKRLQEDFAEFIENDEFLVFDIMKPLGDLTKSEQRRKMVIVAKKQVQNLERLLAFFRVDYTDQANKKVLLVDDEADLASIRFQKRRGAQAITDQGTIANQMDDLRGLLENVAYLQVTATPYSLYLQPKEYSAIPSTQFVFKPKRPAFTVLLPIHSGYVGGNEFFPLDGTRAHLVCIVDGNEQDALRRQDRRRIKEGGTLGSPNTVGLVNALVSFVLGVCIRRWQQEQGGEKKQKYAMIIHNDTQKTAHAWQVDVVKWILAEIKVAVKNNDPTLSSKLKFSFDNLSKSVVEGSGKVPSIEVAIALFQQAFEDDEIMLESVNSDRDVELLLDEKAELRLRTPFNVFVGGSILDRGITIPNLLAFYYGRNPKLMQADTVLQHSRMYGNRNRKDLLVTRFHTSIDVFDRLQRINEFENTLRKAFESGAHDKGVVFIQTDSTGTVRPCAPSKVLLSDVVSVEPSGLFLPTNFIVKNDSTARRGVEDIRKIIGTENVDSGEFFEMSAEKVLECIGRLEKTLAFPNVDFEWNAMRSLLSYYNREGTRSILGYAETGRKLSREASGDKSGKSILGTKLRVRVENSSATQTAFVLLEQEGRSDAGWSGFPFWWPILAVPGNVEPCVFAAKVTT